MGHHGVGPIPARILLVGEAWGEWEDRAGEPFVGPSGQELNRMLQEAGIMRGECFVSNLVNHRPPNNDIGAWIALKKKDITSKHIPLKDKWVLPIVKAGYDQLMTEINACQPNIIVAFGNAAMWALTGNWGVTKWRGSLLQVSLDSLPLSWPDVQSRPKVIPTYHPAAILRQWDWRAVGLNDLRRVKKHMGTREYQRPAWNFIVRPSFYLVQSTLETLLSRLETEDLWIDLDLETSRGHIACIGLSWSRLDAICIPFMTRANQQGYWSEAEEAVIIFQLWKLCTHQRVSIRWQNGLYDAQYIYRHWHFIPRGRQDTMISHHALFSDLPKALHFQASMYAEWYQFWKEDK